MISLTIDVRGATAEQLKNFGEIAGMRDALHELLYRSRLHAETTVAVVGGGQSLKGKTPDAFLAMITAAKTTPVAESAVVSANEDYTETGC